jgi:hypothetical protein
MLVAELFFGRGIKGREPLSDAEWAEFAAQTITPNFPDGFTVFDGDGQWRNPQTGRIAGTRTKILLVAAPRTPIRAAGGVTDAYKARFHHQSVGTTRDSCGVLRDKLNRGLRTLPDIRRRRRSRHLAPSGRPEAAHRAVPVRAGFHHLQALCSRRAPSPRSSRSWARVSQH